MIPSISLLDFETLRLIALAMMSGSLITAFIFWKRWDYRAGPDYWILGVIAYFMVFFLMMFQELAPRGLFGIGKELCITASALWFLRGIRTMMGRNNYIAVEASLTGITLVISILTYSLFPESHAGSVFIALIAGNIAFYSAITLFRSRDYRLLSGRTVCMAFFIVFGLAQYSFILTGITTSAAPTTSLIDSTLVYSGLLVSAITFSLIFAAGSLTQGLRSRATAPDISTDVQSANDNKWLMAMEFSKAGSWEINLGNGEIEVSSQWKKLLGYPESAVFNKLDDYLDLVHPEDRDSLLFDRYAMNRRASDLFSNQHRMKSQSGKWIWVQSHGRKLASRKAGAARLIINDLDINNQKASEYLMRQAVEKAEIASKSKSVFLANMSHEIRTPMNSILGFTQLMMDDETITSQQKENLEIINKSSQHLLELIDGILDLSRIETGNEELQKGLVDLNELLNDVTALFRHDSRKDVTFELTLANDLPRYIVTDSGKLRQICTNLLNNAFKFTSSGTVRLIVNGDRTSANLYSLDISVIDTGEGIAESDQENIFSYIRQVDPVKGESNTHGLGLVISKSLANFLGGDLTFSSVYGKGSNFKLTIPVKLREEVEPLGEVFNTDSTSGSLSAEMARPASEPQLFSGKGKKVLIIDDNPDHRESLSKILTTLEIYISQAEGAIDGLQLIEFWQPDLILMNISLPGLTSDKVVSDIRLNTDWASIPVLAISGASKVPDTRQLLSMGVYDVLASPFNHEEIKGKVIHHLGIKATSPSTSDSHATGKWPAGSNDLF